MQPECSSSIGKCHMDGVPDEILGKIFSYLPHRDLGRAAWTSKRFSRYADDVEIWKKLFQQVFEYTRPLFHSGQAEFEFCDPQKRQEENPWKESFRQLRHGVHVRPGYSKLYEGGNLTHFESLEAAIEFLEMEFLESRKEKLIFLHAGQYVGKGGITIDTNLQIIGAAPEPKIAKKVIIEQSTDTTIRITEGANDAYLGYVTVKFAWANTSGYALEVSNECSPVLDHCTITSSSTSHAGLCVRGPGACPKVQNCVICYCEYVGIFITDQAEGYFEGCNIFDFCGSQAVGMEVTENANPTVVRENEIFGSDCGVDIQEGRVLIESTHFYNIFNNGISWRGENSDPIVRKNKIHDCFGTGILVEHKGRGLVEENDVYRMITKDGVAMLEVRGDSNPVVRHNSFHSGMVGVYFKDNGHGILLANKIFDVEFGVKIESGSNPKIIENKIWGCQNWGIHVSDGGVGVLEGGRRADRDWLPDCCTEQGQNFGGESREVCIVDEQEGKSVAAFVRNCL